MAPVLFGVELLLAIVLWAAAVLAWYGRGNRNWLRWAVTCLAIIALALPLGLMAALIAVFYRSQALDSPLFIATCLLAGLALLAEITLVAVGLRSDVDGTPRARRWPAIRLALAALVCTILAQSTLWMLDAHAHSRLIDLRREAQLLALSVAPQPLRAQENAAPLYRQAFDAMGFNYRPPAHTPPSSAPPAAEVPQENPDDLPAEPGLPDFRTRYWMEVRSRLFDAKRPYDWSSPRLKSLLDRQRGVRDLVLAATERPGCNFDRDYVRPSIDMLLPEVQNARAIAMLLAVDAHHAAALHDWPRAQVDLRAIFRVARHVEEEPLIVVSLVGMALDHLAFDTWRFALSEAPEAPQPLLDDALLPIHGGLSGTRRALQGEEAFGLMALLQIHQQVDPAWFEFRRQNAGADEFAGYFAGTLLRAFLLPTTMQDFRNTYGKLQRIPDQAPSQPIADTLRQAEDIRAHTPLAAALLPALHSYFKAVLRHEVHCAEMRVAMGLYRYYHAPREDGSPRHAFPETLDALFPEYVAFLPSDPFTDGRPLRYRRTNDGCLLYSVGPNLRDDGGQSLEEDRTGLNYDLTCVCLAPHRVRTPPSGASSETTAPPAAAAGPAVGVDPQASLQALREQVEAALRAFDETHSTIYPKGFSRCRLDVQQVTHELLPPAEGQATPRGIVRAQYRETHSVIRPTPAAAAADEELFPRSPREDRPTMLNDRLNPEKPVWDLQIEYAVEAGHWLRRDWSGKARTARGADYLDRLGIP